MNKFLTARDTPLIIAHRGASAEAPENTMAAFELAVKQGADAIECDVQLTRDRQLVIMHDWRINRTTNGRGWVRRMSLRELQQYKVRGTEPIPTLEAVIERFGQRVLINIEIKNWLYPRNDLETMVAQYIKGCQLQNVVMFTSFLPWAGRKIQRVIPEAVFCAAYFPRLNPWMLARFQRSIQVYGPHRRELAISKLHQLHQRGKRINMWIVDDKFEQRQLAKLGVDMIITNVPKQAKAAVTQATH